MKKSEVQVNRGQGIISMVSTIAGILAAIIAPVLYVGGIKETVATQGRDIQANKESATKDFLSLKEDLMDVKETGEYTRRLVEELSRRNGIPVYSPIQSRLSATSSPP